MASKKAGYHPGGSIPPVWSSEQARRGRPTTRRRPSLTARQKALEEAKTRSSAMNKRQQAKSLTRTRKAKQDITNQATPTKTQKPSAARARELMRSGDPAAAIRMLKASSGMKNTRLTSQDALNYLKKTGDKAGAQNIMKSSVGLPQQKQVKAKTPIARPTRTLKALIEAKARAMQNQRQQAKMPTIATGRDQRPTAKPARGRVGMNLERYMQSRGTAKPARGRVGPTARPQRSATTRGRVR